jgi:hypothetical protein
LHAQLHAQHVQFGFFVGEAGIRKKQPLGDRFLNFLQSYMAFKALKLNGNSYFCSTNITSIKIPAQTWPVY